MATAQSPEPQRSTGSANSLDVDPVLPHVRAPEAASPRGALVRFLAAAAISSYGDWLTTVALLVVLYQAGGNSITAPAGYILIRVLPRLFGPSLGGALVDRWSPEAVAGFGAAIQAAVTTGLLFAVRAELIWAIYAAVAASQLLGSGTRPAYVALLPRLVSPQGLNRANSAYSAIYSSSIFVGPAIGAPLLAVFGPSALILGDAVSFAVSAALVLTLRTVRPVREHEPQAERGRFAGMRILLGDPMLRGILAADIGAGALITAVQGALVVAAAQNFGHADWVGFLYAAVGVGGLAGSALAFAWRPTKHARALIGLLALLCIVCLVLFSVTGSFAVALVVLGVGTLAEDIYETWGYTEVQERAHPSQVGRVSGALIVGGFAGMAAGAVWELVITLVLRWDTAVQLLAIAALLVFAIGFIPLRRKTNLPPLHTQVHEP